MSDKASVHYDPRCDRNSRYYDPECDPASRWYNPESARGAVAGGSSSEGGLHNYVPASLHQPRSSDGPAWRTSQPGVGSGWTGGAYGIEAQEGPPRSAPPPPAPQHSPPSKRNSGRGARRGNRSSKADGGGDYGAALSAVEALAGSQGPTDIGSLYYVLGANASSSRVKQLQKILELRRNGGEAKEGSQSARTRQ